jgi:hypothetical protein
MLVRRKFSSRSFHSQVVFPIKVFDVPRLANFRYGIRWTSDGKGVTYRDWANGIWRQPIAGGRPERLYRVCPKKNFSYTPGRVTANSLLSCEERKSVT